MTKRNINAPSMSDGSPRHKAKGLCFGNGVSTAYGAMTGYRGGEPERWAAASGICTEKMVQIPPKKKTFRHASIHIIFTSIHTYAPSSRRWLGALTMQSNTERSFG
jgi:hypothetical protein